MQRPVVGQLPRQVVPVPQVPELVGVQRRRHPAERTDAGRRHHTRSGVPGGAECDELAGRRDVEVGVDGPGDILRVAAARYGDKTALVTGTRTLTFAELDALSDRVAAWLAARGVRAGPGGVALRAEPVGVGRHLPRRAEGGRGRQPGQRHADARGARVRAARLRRRRRCSPAPSRRRTVVELTRDLPGAADRRGVRGGRRRRRLRRAAGRRRPGAGGGHRPRRPVDDRLHVGHHGAPQGRGPEPPLGAAQLRHDRDDARSRTTATSS